MSTEQAPAAPSTLSYLKDNIREFGLLFSLVGIMIFFQIMTNGTLFAPLNLTNLILQNSFIIVMALGMLMVIVAGHIDLSVGSIVAIVGAVAGMMMVTWKMDPLLAVPVCLAVGAAIGAIHGFFIAYMKIPAFIVTLAGMLVFRGLTMALLQGQSLGPFPPEFQKLSAGFIPEFFAVDGLRLTTVLICVALAAFLFISGYRSRLRDGAQGVEQEPFAFFIGKNAVLSVMLVGLGSLIAQYRGLPNVMIVMGVLIAFYTFVTTRTTIGRRIYALGGNEKAAKLSGINTERLTFFTFVNMGALAALAGLIVTARLNSATPKAGEVMELDVIAACFIGGASASGGVGKVMGAVIGALIMGVMNNGMSIMGIGVDYQKVIKGIVLLAAVFLDVYYKKK